MKNIERLQTSTLLLIRQWLLLHATSVKISSEFARLATKCIDDVDKELWHRLISNETPWGEVADEPLPNAFEDGDFESTIKELKELRNVEE